MMTTAQLRINAPAAQARASRSAAPARAARAAPLAARASVGNVAAFKTSSPVQRVQRLRGGKCFAAADEEKAGSGIEKTSTSFDAVLDIDAVMKILPHRFPFLLVDRVIELEGGSHCVAIKNVTINDQFFPGHFPQRPIMPGVLIVEALAQTGGIALIGEEEASEEGTQKLFFFGGVDNCRFRKPVVPGDTLVLKTSLTKLNKRFGIAKMKGEAYVGDTLVCEADLTLALGN